MLGGGFPEGKVVLVCGGPGSGKTILAVQCMIQALGRGEPCLFATLEEPLANIKENMSTFGWDIDAWEKKGLLRTMNLFMMPGANIMNARDRDTGDTESFTIKEITDAAKAIKAKWVFIDPLTSLVIQEPRSGRKRHVIGELFDSLRKLGCTAMVISEAAPQEGDFYMEQFLADGVMLLSKDLQNYNLIKTIRIDKMRGIQFDEQPRRYAISARGFQVMSKEPVLV
ncbi:MAG: gas vesicle protein GvpD [Candidatus Bathyarchaeota archaeon]|nr:gas vesicle protein GvpD [Candidatus Bathyarchaeota archaeon]